MLLVLLSDHFECFVRVLLAHFVLSLRGCLATVEQLVPLTGSHIHNNCLNRITKWYDHPFHTDSVGTKQQPYWFSSLRPNWHRACSFLQSNEWSIDDVPSVINWWQYCKINSLLHCSLDNRLCSWLKTSGYSITLTAQNVCCMFGNGSINRESRNDYQLNCDTISSVRIPSK